MKKKISDEEFNLAYKNTDNKNIIKKVISKYDKIISPDNLESCGDNALWRTLQSHDESYDQKFTTSLYRFCEWECKRELRRNNRKNTINAIGIHNIPSDELNSYSYENSRNFEDFLEILDDLEKEIIEKKFRQNKNMTEISIDLNISKTEVKKKIMLSLQKIKKHYYGSEEYNN